MKRRDLIRLPQALKEAGLWIANEVRAAGGRALFVGGCVRDALWKLEAKDADIEVYGIQVDQLEKLISKKFKVIQVGKAFGVFKIRGLDLDISIPRRESKKGLGHKGFVVEGDPELSFEEAASRRDFTMNAISWDPLTEEIVDPCNGLVDIEKKILRHVGEKFSEDPLRVLRGMQFVARFLLKVDNETLEVCKKIEPEGLSKERIFEEWAKLILKGQKPSLGLEFLKECGWIRYFSELEALIGCQQDPIWHPEGDAWVHTLLCLDAFAAERVGERWDDLVVGFAVLCHDLGKPATTMVDADGRIRSPRHEYVGVGVARSFLERLTAEKELIEMALKLVGMHMRPIELYKARSSDTAVRRLANAVGRLDLLLRVVRADIKGCSERDYEGAYREGEEWLWERAKALEVAKNAPKPIVMGRHLMSLGLQPGESFKAILDNCFEAQLEGKFNDLDGGLKYLKNNYFFEEK